MDNLKERVAAIVAKVSELNGKRDKADALVEELSKATNISTVKTALAEFGKNKNGAK